jgi:NADH-quinone oxidoreductase subunit N
MILDLATPGGMALALLPVTVLTGWAIVVMLVAAWRHTGARDARLAGYLSLAGIAVTGVVVWWLYYNEARAAGIPLMMAVDDFRWVTDALFLLTAALTILLSLHYLEREEIHVPEYYVLILFATIGMMLLGGGEDLLVLFIGLEVMSVAVYVLAGINRRSPAAAEAALKYFLLGAFASGFFLYGVALIYGATGSTNLTLIGYLINSLEATSNPMLLVGVGMLLIGFGFKVAAVPFHMWTPDVYDGAPSPVTAFMASAVKAAAFAALFRVLIEAFGGVDLWRDVIWWLAVATMIVGNLVALAQRSVKRMLAYSSIAHAGYLLVAVQAGNADGAAAFLFYLAAYTLTTLGAFGVLVAKGRGGERDVTIDDLAGLSGERPWLAFAMAVCMLSLLGFPGTAGFLGKWYILGAATRGGETALAVILVLTSVISAGYYLPVIMSMYMKPAPFAQAHAAALLPRLGRAVVIVAVTGLLLFGVWPNRLLDLARESGARLRPPQGASPFRPGQ